MKWVGHNHVVVDLDLSDDKVILPVCAVATAELQLAGRPKIRGGWSGDTTPTMWPNNL